MMKRMVAKIVRKIEEETVLQFSLKAFGGLILSIFTIFFGFYLLVVQPQFKAQDEKFEKNWTEQKVINKELSTSINQLNITLSAFNETLNNLKTDKK